LTEFPVVDIPSPDIPLISGDIARPALCASRGVPYRTVNRSSSLKLYTRVGDAAPRGVDVIRVRLAEVVDADVIVPRSREKPSRVTPPPLYKLSPVSAGARAKRNEPAY
jgi:hypothetical protein